MKTEPESKATPAELVTTGPPAELVETPAERGALVSAPPIDLTPGQMISLAMNRGASMSEIGDLVALYREERDDAARRAYTAAMARFKKANPRIIKSKLVDQGAGRPKYIHATLGNVTDEVTGPLADEGLSAAWQMSQTDKTIRVTCVVTHANGHFHSVPLEAQTDSGPGRNSIQAVASTITYLERYTLLGALGLATHDSDDDGIAAGGRRPPPKSNGSNGRELDENPAPPKAAKPAEKPLKNIEPITRGQCERLCSFAQDTRLPTEWRKTIKERFAEHLTKDRAQSIILKVRGKLEQIIGGKYDPLSEDSPAPHDVDPITGVCEICKAQVHEPTEPPPTSDLNTDAELTPDDLAEASAIAAAALAETGPAPVCSLSHDDQQASGAEHCAECGEVLSAPPGSDG